MTIKLDGKLPAEADRNGLDALAAKLLAEPRQLHAVIMVVDCKSFERDYDSETDVPKARVRAVEAISPDDLQVAQSLMNRAREKRLGRVQLPFGLEDEIRTAFRGSAGDD